MIPMSEMIAFNNHLQPKDYNKNFLYNPSILPQDFINKVMGMPTNINKLPNYVKSYGKAEKLEQIDVAT